jgi:hypothetical protein
MRVGSGRPDQGVVVPGQAPALAIDAPAMFAWQGLP